MFTSLIAFLVAALVAYIVWYVLCLFIKDATVQKIIGLILGLLVLAFGLKQFGIFT